MQPNDLWFQAPHPDQNKHMPMASTADFVKQRPRIGSLLEVSVAKEPAVGNDGIGRLACQYAFLKHTLNE